MQSTYNALIIDMNLQLLLFEVIVFPKGILTGLRKHRWYTIYRRALPTCFQVVIFPKGKHVAGHASDNPYTKN